MINSKFRFIVPYNYKRESKNWRYMKKRECNDINKIARRIIRIKKYRWSDDTCRYNIFKNNIKIKNNFKDCSYKNKWY